jgi:DNA polymerase III epsilon subunit-like protein
MPDTKKYITFAGFDLETTGLSVQLDHTTEIGVVVSTGWISAEGVYTEERRGKWQTYVYTDRAIKDDGVSGLTAASLVGAPKFLAAATAMCSFLQTWREDTDVGLITYNGLAYDLPLFSRQLSESKVIVDPWFRKMGIVAHLDLKQEVSSEYALARFSLGFVHKARCQKEIEHAHTAVADAEATLNLFLKCRHAGILHSLPSWNATMLVLLRDTGISAKKLFGSQALRAPTLLRFGAFSCQASLSPSFPFGLDVSFEDQFGTGACAEIDANREQDLDDYEGSCCL